MLASDVDDVCKVTPYGVLYRPQQPESPRELLTFWLTALSLRHHGVLYRLNHEPMNRNTHTAGHVIFQIARFCVFFISKHPYVASPRLTYDRLDALRTQPLPDLVAPGFVQTNLGPREEVMCILATRSSGWRDPALLGADQISFENISLTNMESSILHSSSPGP